MQKSFTGGVLPSHNKSLTKAHNIQIMPAPKMVFVPLLQHIGAAAKPTVRTGEEVVKGQLIARAEKGGANIFAPCCGRVRGIEMRAMASWASDHIIIENNGKNDNAHLPPLVFSTPAEVVKRIEDCGIVGMGGAGFPTHKKLDPKSHIDTLIINGAECEPYITCDHRIMLEYTEKLLSGVQLMAYVLSAERVIIGVEDNKADAILALNDCIRLKHMTGITVQSLRSKYPQGSDKQLIYALTGMKIPKGVRSASRGVVVSNVHTALSVDLAVREGRQCYSRVMTVSGGAITNPKNIWAVTGATFADVIDFCGGEKADNPAVKIISGGPMMGRAVFSKSVAVAKTTSSILLFGANEAKAEKPSACINCGKCGEVCPMRLMPMNIDAYSLVGDFKQAKKWGADYCIECGCCSYICPAKRELVPSVVLAKNFKEEANG